jgi:hypothetical protein
MKTKRLRSNVYEKDISINRYLGQNTFGEHFSLALSESRRLKNWDIYEGPSKDEDFLKSRRGSQFLRAVTSPIQRGTTDIQNGLVWDIGTIEYLITQEGNKFYSQNLTNTENPVEILTASSTTFTIGETDQSDMFLTGDRLFIFSPSGNKVIEYNSTTELFFGRSMGLTAPVIGAITTANAGVISGTYTVGVELCYFNELGEKLASTPNRVTTGRILAQTGLISSKKIKVTIQSTELADTTWTHLRFWRSKNTSMDLTDPNNPIDAQGIPNELYEEALITRAEMEAGSLTSVATGSTLPIGNAGCQAGKPAGVYTIEVNNLDSVFSILVNEERIELEPITACEIGCYHEKKIFFSRVNDDALDQNSKNLIYYANFADTKYCEQYNLLNVVSTNQDGQRMIKLLSVGSDLVGIKESKTGILPGGNINQKFQIIDHHIGIADKRKANFIPGVGICAITNDGFQIFTNKWSDRLNGIDISKPISDKEFGDYTSFIYINGKLIISDGTGIMYALHVASRRGWTEYEYLTDSAQLVVTYSNNTKALIASKNYYMLEIEVEGVNTDVSLIDGTIDHAVFLEEITPRFRHEEGKSIIEHFYLEVMATLSYPLTGTPYLNGRLWPLITSATQTDFTPSFGYTGESRTDIFRLYISPADIGAYKWCKLVGNYLHYRLTTYAPAVIKRKNLRVVIDEDGISFGGFDPFNEENTQEPEFVENIIDGGLDDTTTEEIDGGLDDTTTEEIDGGLT